MTTSMTPTFFRAGRHIINLANVAYVEDFDSHADVVFSAMKDDKPLKVTLTGEDAPRFVEEVEHWTTNA